MGTRGSGSPSSRTNLQTSSLNSFFDFFFTQRECSSQSSPPAPQGEDLLSGGFVSMSVDRTGDPSLSPQDVTGTVQRGCDTSRFDLRRDGLDRRSGGLEGQGVRRDLGLSSEGSRGVRT